MNVVDSSGWLEYFADGPNAYFFEPPILDLKNLVVPTLSLFEVFKRIIQLMRYSGHKIPISSVLTMLNYARKKVEVINLHQIYTKVDDVYELYA